MPTDLTLKQALADMETAWRRLREVLDGPDVAAALVERQAVRPMSTAPRDGTWITGHIAGVGPVSVRWRASGTVWRDHADNFRVDADFAGWTPIERHLAWSMSTAPRDGSMVKLHLREGKPLKACWSTAYDCWVDESRNMVVTPLIIGWSPVK